MATNFPLSIAPMMDYTDRHFRMLMRMLTKRTVLYTEMISTKAILNGNRQQLLSFSQEEKPLILQVGGDNPQELAECTKIAADYGYDEININIGCPSERVHKGSFGASLMLRPNHVGDMITAMCATNTIPVSVKCRIGVDGTKIGLPSSVSYENLLEFSQLVKDAGASRLTVHARIAILGGLSPKENREVPPLQYPLVHTLAKDLSGYRVEINGGICTLDDIDYHLNKVSGVMIGRIAVDNPMLLTSIDHRFDNHKTNHANISRKSLAQQYAYYLQQIQSSVYTNKAIRHLIPLYNGIAGARKWRSTLSECLQKNTEPELAVAQALKYVATSE